MQRLSGALMVLAGTALGGYMVLPAPNFTQISRAPAPSASPASDRDAASLITSALAQTRAATSAAGTTPHPVAAASEAPSNRVFSPAQPLQAAPTITSTWSTVVTNEPGTSSKFSSSKPGDQHARTQLASDLQRELKRVGCYAGDITGTWTLNTKAAMSTFMERVNATLPVEEPDYILLTLVQGHASIACGAECPPGQTQSSAGKCVPQAVVAQASRKTQRDEERRALEQRKAQQQERLAEEQRAAEAKRIAEARKAAEDKHSVEKLAAARRAAEQAEAAKLAVIAPPAPQPAVRPSAKSQQVAKVEPERLPWLDQPSSQTTAAPLATAAITPPAARTEPLPGRMAIGGPRDLPLDPPATIAAIVPDKSGAPAVPAQSDDRLQVKIVPPPIKAESHSQSEAAPALAPPRPQPAVRHAALPGLPGSKSGVAVQGLPGSKAGVTARGQPGSKAGIAVRNPAIRPFAAPKYKYTGPRIVHRPPPVVVSTPKPKYQYYASTGKVRRGQPRPGSMQYNVMHSLGGIY